MPKVWPRHRLVVDRFRLFFPDIAFRPARALWDQVFSFIQGLEFRDIS
ncbi:MAG: hypothetical protein IID51_02765 [Proteobacteria bacterium]|nr:hypothetical protein [Pseudomonadota bacterium]